MCLPFGGLLALDTAPPVLDVVNVQPFILHCLVTISLDEEGYVYCGALMSAAGGTYTPSAFQLKTGSGLDGHGLSAAHPNTHTHVILAGLSPGTAYDVYCYAEDLLLNGVAAAEVAASRQPGVVTASGGDYVAPTLEYVAPLEVIENTAITLFVRLSEDGTVWCVARQDRGAGTVAPSAAQVRGNLDVDAWGVEAVTAAGSYKAAVRLPGLREGSVYDAYCFAVDASGNGLDGSPALVPDPGAIGATKRAGLRTLLRLQATELRVHTSTGERRCAAEPAAWNSLLPRQAAPGSWGPPSFQAAGLVAPAAAASHGCGQLPAAPRGGGPLVAVLRRGRCGFGEKALRAQRAGYHGILLVDHQREPAVARLPDMTAGERDHAVRIPGWAVGHGDGEDILGNISISVVPVTASVADVRRKPRLGDFQSDEFGLRRYMLH